MKNNETTTVPVTPWIPTWKWHLKVLGVIFVILMISYVGISSFLLKVGEPYKLREIPKEVTPWVK